MTGTPAASSCSMRRSPFPSSPAISCSTACRPRPLLSDAAQFSLLEGHAKLALQISRRRRDLRGDQVVAARPGQPRRERRRHRGHRPHRDDQPDRRGPDSGDAPGAGRQDRVQRSRRQLHHQERHRRDEQSADDQPAAQGGGGRHRGPDAKHDQHAGQSGDRWRARGAGRRQRSRRALRAGPHRGPARSSDHQARDQGHVRQSRARPERPSTRSARRCRRSSRASRSARRSAASSAMSRSAPRATATTARPSPNRTAALGRNRLRLPAPEANDTEQGDSDETGDPDLDSILR